MISGRKDGRKKNREQREKAFHESCLHTRWTINQLSFFERHFHLDVAAGLGRINSRRQSFRQSASPWDIAMPLRSARRLQVLPNLDPRFLYSVAGEEMSQPRP